MGDDIKAGEVPRDQRRPDRGDQLKGDNCGERGVVGGQQPEGPAAEETADVDAGERSRARSRERQGETEAGQDDEQIHACAAEADEAYEDPIGAENGRADVIEPVLVDVQTENPQGGESAESINVGETTRGSWARYRGGRHSTDDISVPPCPDRGTAACSARRGPAGSWRSTCAGLRPQDPRHHPPPRERRRPGRRLTVGEGTISSSHHAPIEDWQTSDRRNGLRGRLRAD